MKYTKYRKHTNITNTSYRFLIYNKMKIGIFEKFRSASNILGFWEMYLCIVGVICTINCHF